MRRVGDLIDQIDLHGQNKELVDELVALSTKYGILTPYTSFLADERVQLHARSENAHRSSVALHECSNQVSGQFGVAQRDFKQCYIATRSARSRRVRSGRSPSGTAGRSDSAGVPAASAPAAAAVGRPAQMARVGGRVLSESAWLGWHR